jgi:hypothetical protein
VLILILFKFKEVVMIAGAKLSSDDCWCKIILAIVQGFKKKEIWW